MACLAYNKPLHQQPVPYSESSTLLYNVSNITVQCTLATVCYLPVPDSESSYRESLPVPVSNCIISVLYLYLTIQCLYYTCIQAIVCYLPVPYSESSYRESLPIPIPYYTMSVLYL